MIWFEQFKDKLKTLGLNFTDGIEFIEFRVKTPKGYLIRFFIDTEGDFFELSAYASIGVSNIRIENYEILNKYNNNYKMFKFSFTEPGNVRIEVDIPLKFYRDSEYTLDLIYTIIKIVDDIADKFAYYMIV